MVKNYVTEFIGTFFLVAAIEFSVITGFADARRSRSDRRS